VSVNGVSEFTEYDVYLRSFLETNYPRKSPAEYLEENQDITSSAAEFESVNSGPTRHADHFSTGK
jgi:hypothetical protein